MKWKGYDWSFNSCIDKKDFVQKLVNMKDTGLIGYVYDFSVDYDSIAVADILDIHKYLMKKNGIV